MVLTETHSTDRGPQLGVAAGSILGCPPGELALRVRGATRAERTVRLSAQKCTLGSDPGCTLPLEELGIRPLHCLILRGESQTVVRRWSPDTRLNGRDFSDALLQSGDKLPLGPLELEVLPWAAAPVPPVPPRADVDLESRRPDLAAARLRDQHRQQELRRLECFLQATQLLLAMLIT